MTEWFDRWNEGRTGFHLDAPNPRLQAHHPRWVGSANRPDAPAGRVLVPLCGKTVDLIWLRDQGHEVVGTELVPKAVEQFYADHAIEAEQAEHDAHIRHEGAGITVWAGDFFELSSEQTGSFELIWDRASTVALPASLRPRYAAHLMSFLEPGGRILMVNFAYDQSEMSGPPYSLSGGDIAELFGDRCDIDTLSDDDGLVNAPRWQARLSALRISVSLLTLRSGPA